MSESEFQKPPREDDDSAPIDSESQAEESSELAHDESNPTLEPQSVADSDDGEYEDEHEEEDEEDEDEYEDEEDDEYEYDYEDDEEGEDEVAEPDDVGDEAFEDVADDQPALSDEPASSDESASSDEPVHARQPEGADVVVASEHTAEQTIPRPHVAVIPRSSSWVAPSGNGNLLRTDADGKTVIDALAGRTSVLGLDCVEWIESIRSSMGVSLGDGSAFPMEDSSEDSLGLRDAMAKLLGPGVGDLADSLFLTASPDLAVETAILSARRRRSDRAFRTVALVGSDHGRTAMCRTASGRPELHEDLGPLVAGFAHVPVGDVQALDVAVDEQTACVLISPNLWSRGGEVLDADYLGEVRRLCDERGVLLAVDETQVVFGSTGHPLAINSIAEVRPDIVALSSGLFAGLPGGITLASSRVTGDVREDAARYPLLAAVVSSTLHELGNRGLLDSVSSASESLAVELAQRVSRFEFVRDVHVLGLSIGIETDLDSHQLVKAAAQRHFRVETAGETAIRMQLPLVYTDEDQNLLLEAMEETFSSIQLETADLSA